MSFKDDDSQCPKYEAMQGAHRREAGTRRVRRAKLELSYRGSEHMGQASRLRKGPVYATHELIHMRCTTDSTPVISETRRVVL